MTLSSSGIHLPVLSIADIAALSQSDFESHLNQKSSQESLVNTLNNVFQCIREGDNCNRAAPLLQSQITIIQARLKITHITHDSAKTVELLQKIETIATVLEESQQNPRVTGLIANQNNDILTKLPDGYLLTFPPTLTVSITDTIFQHILSSLDPQLRANIVYFNISMCPQLTTQSIEPLLHYCPRLRCSSFASIFNDSRFLDYTLKIQDEIIGVNAAVVSHYAPNILKPGFKEDQERCTILEETSPQTVKDLLTALTNASWTSLQEDRDRLIELLFLAERFLVTDVSTSCEQAVICILSPDRCTLDLETITSLHNRFKPFFALNRYQQLLQTLQKQTTAHITTIADLENAVTSEYPLNYREVLLSLAQKASGMQHGGSDMLEQLNLLAKKFISPKDYKTTQVQLQEIAREQFRKEFIPDSSDTLIAEICNPTSRLQAFLEKTEHGWNLLNFTPKSRMRVTLHLIIQRLLQEVMRYHSDTVACPTNLLWFYDFLERRDWNSPEVHTARGLISLFSWHDRKCDYNIANQEFKKALENNSFCLLAIYGLLEITVCSLDSEIITMTATELLSKCNIPNFTQHHKREVQEVLDFYLFIHSPRDTFPEKIQELERNQNTLDIHGFFTIGHATGVFGIEKNIEKARKYFELINDSLSYEAESIFSQLITGPITSDLLNSMRQLPTVVNLSKVPLYRLITKKIFDHLEDSVTPSESQDLTESLTKPLSSLSVGKSRLTPPTAREDS